MNKKMKFLSLKKFDLKYGMISFLLFLVSFNLNSLAPGLFSKQTDQYTTIYSSDVFAQSNYIFTILISKITGLEFVTSSILLHSLIFFFTLKCLYKFKIIINNRFNISISFLKLIITIFGFPSFVYFFSTSLREVDISMLCLITIVSSINFRYHKNIFDLSTLVFSLYSLFVLRAEYLPFFLFTVLILIYASDSKFIKIKFWLFSFLLELKKGINIKLKNLYFILILIFSFLLFLLLFNQVFINIYESFLSKTGIQNVDISFLQYLDIWMDGRFNRTADAGSNLSCGNYTSLCSTIAFAFAPIPLNPIKNPLFILVFFDSLLLLRRFYRLIRINFKSNNYMTYINYSIVPILSLAVLLALITFNVGNIFRMRISIVPSILFLLTFFGFKMSKESLQT